MPRPHGQASYILRRSDDHELSQGKEDTDMSWGLGRAWRINNRGVSRYAVAALVSWQAV